MRVYGAPAPKLYRLTDDEVAVVNLIAARRNRLNFGGSNVPNDQTDKETLLKQACRGVAAEIAVSRYFNLCWSGCGKGSEGLFDVGNCLQVRSVDDDFRGLLVRSKDVPDHACVLVQVAPDYNCALLGWEYHRTVIQRGRQLDGDTTKPCWILSRNQLQRLEKCPIQLILDLW